MIRFSHVLSILVTVAFCCTACSSAQTGDDYTERMAKEHAGDTPVPAAASMPAQTPKTAITTEDVTYATIDGKAIKGFLAKPKSGSKAAVIVIHEWWGLNDNIKKMAEKLAQEGYTALAVDLYSGQAATTPDKAREVMSSVFAAPEKAQDNLSQAHNYLKTNENAQRLGSIGWCFGGGWSLQTALMQKSDASVIYYGRLVTEKDKLQSLETPLLGIFGAEDKGIPVANVKRFEATLSELGKEHAVHIYEGANHAFANPSGKHYNPEAAMDAWSKTTDFLAKHLKP